MITAALAAAGLAAASLAAGTPPSTGAGIGAGNICLNSPAQPGGTYRPGAVYVSDTGSSTETVDLTGGPLWPGQQVYKGEQAISPSWVSFSPAPVTLSPGQGTSVPVTVMIPAGARRGIYVADIVAVPQAGPRAAAGNGGRARLGGAAQTFLIFTVGPGEPPPSCTLPPAPGSPWAAQYAPHQPQDATVSMAWLRQHLPWVFGKHAPAQAPAASTATPYQPSVPRAGYGVLAALAALAAVVLAWRRQRRGHGRGGQAR
jgi:hypothetical protein